ncbi:MAG: hypothetical protein AAF310_04845 [Myxococcota bacterium]
MTTKLSQIYAATATALFLMVSAGCVSRAQGEQLLQQQQQLRREIAALQRQQQVLKQQVQTAASGSANGVVQHDRMVAQLQGLAGQVQQLHDELTQIKQQTAGATAHADAFAGLDKNQHLQQAQQLLHGKHYEQAYQAYDALLQRTTKGDAVFAAALLGKAEACLQWARNSARDHQAAHYKQAVRAYHEFLTQVPENSRKQETPGVLKQAIEALQVLGMHTEAKAFQQELKRITASSARKKKRSG